MSKRKVAVPKGDHGQGCHCFLCDLDREGLVTFVSSVASRYGVAVEDIGAGGRAASPHVGAARRDVAGELVGREKWSANAAARLLRVDPGTLRYWLGKGAPDA